MNQPDLFEPTRFEQMREEFIRFHGKHPEVWEVFVAHIFRLKKRGFSHYSSRTLISVMRFHADVGDIKRLTGFKINDHHTPFYARVFSLLYPEFGDFFSMRVQISKEQDRIAGVVSISPTDTDRGCWFDKSMLTGFIRH
jgi:hypothetical protein